MNNRQKQLLGVIRKNRSMPSSLLRKELKEEVSLITVKRDLQNLVKSGFISAVGKGRSLGYEITLLGKIHNPLDAKDYCSIEQDKRSGEVGYNFDLFNGAKFALLTNEETETLEESTKQYVKNKQSATDIIHKKELERFIIELSWKSSQIEGNTYTLLNTEKLLKDGIASKTNTMEEATMILNHKDAFNFVLDNIQKAEKINSAFIEEVHKILVKDLNVSYGLRKSLVGITGSNYRPLDNVHQITEAVEKLCKTTNAMPNRYEKALLMLIGLSYIQPFEDGNKRTARLVTNAVLLAHNLAPLSYRNVNEALYKEAMLTFYETNSIFSIKNIFIEQYLFSCRNYNGI